MSSQLIDTFGRQHNNLRISVTDRCNLRCTYCMPEDVVFMDRSALLTFEEITHFVRVAAPLGIDKVRLTGGEPLMRRDLSKLVRMLADIPGLRDLGLTTNGLLLAEHAQALHDAGLRRINISLDTLSPERFKQLTRREGLERVLEMRFIEYMPIGADHWERDKVYFAHEILEQIEREVGPLMPAEDYDPRAPAMEFRYADGGGRVGIIASVSRPFCLSCNRLRLTAEGKLRNCLFALTEI